MKRILIADDTPDMLELMCAILEPLNVEIDLASDGKEAFEFIMDNNYDIVITDNNMPKLSGICLIENCKKLGTDTKFLLVTADSVVGIFDKVEVGFGPDSFLSKPFHSSDLFNIIEQWLE